MDVDQLMAEDGQEPEPLQVIAPLQEYQDLDVGELMGGPVQVLSNVEQPGHVLVRDDEHHVAAPNADESDQEDNQMMQVGLDQIVDSPDPVFASMMGPPPPHS